MKVWILLRHYEMGMESYEAEEVDSVHENEESAKKAKIKIQKDHKQDFGYSSLEIREYEVQNVKNFAKK